MNQMNTGNYSIILLYCSGPLPFGILIPLAVNYFVHQSAIVVV